MSETTLMSLTVIVAARLRVAGLVLHSLALAVLPSVLGHRVGALPVGELHPAPTRPGALLPRPPQAPAAVHNHLRGGGEKHERGKSGRVKNGRSELRASGSLSCAAQKPQSGPFFWVCGRAAC